MVDRRERIYLLREGHLLGGTMALLLEHFAHLYAVGVYLLLVTVVLWLWPAAHSGTPEREPHA